MATSSTGIYNIYTKRGGYFSRHIAVGTPEEVATYREVLNANGEEVATVESGNTFDIKEAARKGIAIHRCDIKSTIWLEGYDIATDYTLIKRGLSRGGFDYIVAWALNLNDCTWGQGHYFNDRKAAADYMTTKREEV